MIKQGLFISKLIVVFIISTGFLTTDDTIIKGKGNTAHLALPTKVTPENLDADSLVAEATKDVIKFNKSEEAKNQSNLKVLESNKKMLEYEKKENKLIQQVIVKLRSSSKEEAKDINAKIDSVCTRYKSPLFGKKRCIEYTPIYTIVKDGKEIKLKEIK